MGKSLQQLSNEFKKWRDHCKQPGRVPAALKAQVLDCMQNHTRSQIGAATGLSQSTLCKWEQQNTSMPSEASHFISLIPVSESDDVDNTKPPTIEEPHKVELKIMLPNGLQAMISGHSIEQTSHLLFLLAKEAK